MGIPIPQDIVDRRQGARRFSIRRARQMPIAFPDRRRRSERRIRERTQTRGRVVDITARRRADEQRKRIEERLRQAEKLEAIGRLSAGVAHHLNDIVATVIGNLELLATELQDRPELFEVCERALTASARGANLSQQLQSFSRKQPLDPQSIDMNHFVGDMGDLLARTMGDDFEIKTVQSHDGWTCRADRVQLERAVICLANNARDAMPGGGTMTLESANVSLGARFAALHEGVSPGEYVVLTVRDTGCGMQPDVVRRAFDPFFTTKSAGEGCGLGLCMVHGFATQSGGHVTVETKLDEGTAVSVCLPREAAPGSPPPVSANGKVPKGNGETVLVVEDDPGVRSLTVSVLQGLGYKTLVAEHAPGALEILAGVPNVDVMVSDIVLPGGRSGVELARQATVCWPNIKVVLMSYAADQIDSEQFGRCVHLMQKPIQSTTLGKMIDKLLRCRPSGPNPQPKAKDLAK
ncbi:MAG: ATP-binding protein [Gemmatimonadetes bacterium]|nr:ATP-binding protein [Gemmatimonadota bacterium]